MIWQDLVFLVGSVSSMVVLVPTLRDASAKVPLGTSLPSAAIGTAYAVAFFTLGMSLSAAGSLITGVTWALIATLRSPTPELPRLRRRRSGRPGHDADRSHGHGAEPSAD